MLRAVTQSNTFIANNNEINKINKQESQQLESKDKLSVISEQIQNGKYQINLEKLARKIADEFI